MKSERIELNESVTIGEIAVQTGVSKYVFAAHIERIVNDDLTERLGETSFAGAVLHFDGTVSIVSNKAAEHDLSYRAECTFSNEYGKTWSIICDKYWTV